LYAALDRLENAGKLSEGDRYKGDVIIKAYRGLEAGVQGSGYEDFYSQSDRAGNEQ